MTAMKKRSRVVSLVALLGAGIALADNKANCMKEAQDTVADCNKMCVDAPKQKGQPQRMKLSVDQCKSMCNRAKTEMEKECNGAKH
jgi:hypothetical protein